MGDPVDHYHVLDVSPRASGHEIYDAYCRAVRHWLQTDSSFNHDILNRLQDSYCVLQNPYKRKDFHNENYGNHLPYDGQLKKRSQLLNYRDQPHGYEDQTQSNHNQLQCYEDLTQYFAAKSQCNQDQVQFYDVQPESCEDQIKLYNVQPESYEDQIQFYNVQPESCEDQTQFYDVQPGSCKELIQVQPEAVEDLTSTL